jgi:hypothetical protein
MKHLSCPRWKMESVSVAVIAATLRRRNGGSEEK